MKRRTVNRGLVYSIFAVLALSFNGLAQQAIFNVPSTDVLQKGGVYMEYDVTFKPNTQPGLKKFSSIVPRFVFGVGRNIEVGVNFLGNVQPGSGMKTISPNAKWRVYNSEKRRISVVVGGSLFFPFSNRAYKFGAYSYAQVSKTFGRSGTRITSGAYYFTKNVVAEKASRGGGQFGIEQPLTERFGLMADWLTGKNSAGYFTPGIYFRPTKRVTGYLGYSIGNQNAHQGNHFLYGAIGMTFY